MLRCPLNLAAIGACRSRPPAAGLAVDVSPLRCSVFARLAQASKDRRFVSGYIRSLLTALLLAVQTSTWGEIPKINRFGFDGFRLMLQQHDLATLQTSTDESFGSPTETAVVLVGNLDQAAVLFGELQGFVQNGGAALVATDLGTRQALFGARFHRGPIAAPRDAYRGLSDCPVVTEVGRSKELMKGVHAIVTNRPGYLSQAGPRQLSFCCTLPTTDRPRRCLMAFRHYPRRGRILLVADHSLFINEMLMHGDNAKLASNVADWLCDGRRNLVFIEDGQVLPAWQLGAAPESIPLSELIDEAQRRGLSSLIPDTGVFSVVNEMATSFEDNNGFNRKLAYPFYRVGERSIWRILALAAFALTLFGFFKWLLLSRSKLWRWRARILAGKSAEPHAIASLRHHEYGPCLRLLVREFFSVDHAPTWQPKQHPRVISQINRRWITRQVRSYWRLATAEPPRRVTRRRFRKLTKSLTVLRRLQSNGLLRLEWLEPGTS